MKSIQQASSSQKIKACLQKIKSWLTPWEYHQLHELHKNRPHMAEPIILRTTSNLDSKNNIEEQSYDFFGRTPLHIAIAHGNIWKIQQLLAIGIEPNAQTSLGQTALHYILLTDRLQLSSKLIILNLLAKYQELELDTKDIFGATPLIYATQLNHEDIFIRLVKHGANIYLPGNNGNTPLHWAAWEHNIPVCIYLVNVASTRDGYEYRTLTSHNGSIPYNKLFETSAAPTDQLKMLLHPNNQPKTPLQYPLTFRLSSISKDFNW